MPSRRQRIDGASIAVQGSISANLSFSGLSECSHVRALCPRCLKNSYALDDY